MIHDQGFDPPEPCSACTEFYAYSDGLCWNCWHEQLEIRAEQRAEERARREMEERND